VPVKELHRRWEQDRAPQPPVTSIIGVSQSTRGALLPAQPNSTVRARLSRGREGACRHDEHRVTALTDHDRQVAPTAGKENAARHGTINIAGIAKTGDFSHPHRRRGKMWHVKESSTKTADC
jgi:hypothetical protein